ncbi:MAG: hypothetical protein LC650_04530 [Actinobacteria bacterium]|nr:hypothetical protein [Actinomycetota bacterium]
MALIEEFKGAVAGFELYGHRLKDNMIKLGNGKIIEGWPEEVVLLGWTYTLEEVVEHVDGFENAVYV